MSNALRSRLMRLEARRGMSDGRCPDCLPIQVAYRRSGEPEPDPPVCPNCGRLAEVVEFIECVVTSREPAERFALGSGGDHEEAADEP